MEKIDVKVFNNSNNDLPKYETEFSAGLDVRADYSKIDNINEFIGNDGYYFDKDEDGNLLVVLEPQGRILIPTNLHPAIPDGFEIQVRPRSGLALKHGIMFANNVGTIDSDYRGSIGCILLNTSNKEFKIPQGERIGQAVLNEVKQINWVEVKSKEHLGETVRGEGGFGHTGTK